MWIFFNCHHYCSILNIERSVGIWSFDTNSSGTIATNVMKGSSLRTLMQMNQMKNAVFHHLSPINSPYSCITRLEPKWCLCCSRVGVQVGISSVWKITKSQGFNQILTFLWKKNIYKNIGVVFYGFRGRPIDKSFTFCIHTFLLINFVFHIAN